MARSLKGETTELSEQAEAMQTAMNPQLARADEPIDNAVGNLTKKYAGKEPQTLVDMMVAMQLASDAAAAGKDKSSQKLLGSALTEAGWVKKREMVNGVRTIRWHAPFCAECARYEGGAISNLRCPQHTEVSRMSLSEKIKHLTEYRASFHSTEWARNPRFGALGAMSYTLRLQFYDGLPLEFTDTVSDAELLVKGVYTYESLENKVWEEAYSWLEHAEVEVVA